MTVKEAIFELQNLEALGKGDSEIFVPDWAEEYSDDGRLSGFFSPGSSDVVTIQVN